MDHQTPMTKVLILAANPKGTSPLRLDQELRDIAEGLQRAQKRDQFTLQQHLAVRPRDIQRAMLDFNPQIVHFSGHGAGEEGLVFENEIGQPKLVSGDALAGLFELFADQIECVVLNGCYSEVQANALAQHINYVIGMSKAIGDQAAIEFAIGFYDALGAGRPIEFAYKLGCSAIRMAGIEEHLTPVLLKKSGASDSIIQKNLADKSPVKPYTNLTGSQREEILKAIVNAYPEESDLERVIDFKLEEKLNVIAGGRNYQEVVFNLLKWADSRGKLAKLIEVLANENPGNQQLNAIKQKLLAAGS